MGIVRGAFTRPKLRQWIALALAAGAAFGARADGVLASLAVEQLLNYAESTYPSHFPSRQATLRSGKYLYRHYPETDVYLGVEAYDEALYSVSAPRGVWVLGGSFGPSPLYVGEVSNFITRTEPQRMPASTANNGCRDFALEVPGFRRNVEYRTRYMDRADLYWERREWTTVGEADFEGRSVVRTDESKGSGSFSQTYRRYARATGPGELTEYGQVREVKDGSRTTLVQTTSYSPPYVDRRYSLAPGETIRQSNTSTFTHSVPGEKDLTSTSTADWAVTYAGRERIQVPAGTFDTCRFVMTQASGVNTWWSTVGSNIVIRETAGVSVREAVAVTVTVNGRPL